MAIRTWEVKLLAGNNGVIQTNVEADDWAVMADNVGVVFNKNLPNDEVEAVAFFPVSTPVSALLSVKDVTP